MKPLWRSIYTICFSRIWQPALKTFNAKIDMRCWFWNLKHVNFCYGKSTDFLWIFPLVLIKFLLIRCSHSIHNLHPVTHWCLLWLKMFFPFLLHSAKPKPTFFNTVILLPPPTLCLLLPHVPTIAVTWSNMAIIQMHFRVCIISHVSTELSIDQYSIKITWNGCIQRLRCNMDTMIHLC